jgi:hypothetical protein
MLYQHSEPSEVSLEKMLAAFFTPGYHVQV